MASSLTWGTNNYLMRSYKAIWKPQEGYVFIKSIIEHLLSNHRLTPTKPLPSSIRLIPLRSPLGRVIDGGEVRENPLKYVPRGSAKKTSDLRHSCSSTHSPADTTRLYGLSVKLVCAACMYSSSVRLICTACLYGSSVRLVYTARLYSSGACITYYAGGGRTLNLPKRDGNMLTNNGNVPAEAQICR